MKSELPRFGLTFPPLTPDCRFGQQLRSSHIKDYYWHYISYDELKEALKPSYLEGHDQNSADPQRRRWNEDDEKAFVQRLEAELDKVFTFQKLKSGEIVSR